MFKKMVRVIIFVFVAGVFCSLTPQISYAARENKQSVEVEAYKVSEVGDLPTKWTPNSELRNYDSNGELTQIRRYGPDGRAVQDTDYGHGGPNHEFPHTHEWDWSRGDIDPRRGKDNPLPGAKKITTKNNKKGGKNGKSGKKKDFFKFSKKSKKRAKRAVKKAVILGTIVTIGSLVISGGSSLVFLIPAL